MEILKSGIEEGRGSFTLMAFVTEPPPLRRDWLAELLDELGNLPAEVD